MEAIVGHTNRMGFQQNAEGTALAHEWHCKDTSSRALVQHKKLPEDRAQPFHRLIVKLLYQFMCTRQDIQTVVAFVSTRVKKPDEDNYKTQEFMQCIRGTRELTLTIAKQRPKVVGAEFICSPP